MIVSLLPKFIVQQMELYDASEDLVNQLENFKAHTVLHKYLKQVACWAFLLTLKGVTRNWFGALKPEMVDNFEELTRYFLT